MSSANESMEALAITMMAAENAIPTIDIAARNGRRDRLRRTMRSGWERKRRSPRRSSRDTRNFSGAAGRIASAGGRRTTLRTAEAAPSTAAAPQAKSAARMFDQFQWATSAGKV